MTEIGTGLQNSCSLPVSDRMLARHLQKCRNMALMLRLQKIITRHTTFWCMYDLKETNLNSADKV